MTSRYTRRALCVRNAGKSVIKGVFTEECGKSGRPLRTRRRGQKTSSSPFGPVTRRRDRNLGRSGFFFWGGGRE